MSREPRRIVLLRHGRSVANELGLIASHPANAGAAYGLTPLGRDQVRRSVEGACATGLLEPPFVLLSSPLLRALESADVVAEMLGTRASVDARLTERDFGELEQGPDSMYPRVWEADRRDPAHGLWGVESAAHVLVRAGAAVRDAFGDGRGGTVLLCTHGDVASVLLCAAIGVALGRHREVGALGTGEIRMLPMSLDGILEREP